jgi:hypothetical protein
VQATNRKDRGSMWQCSTAVRSYNEVDLPDISKVIEEHERK